MRAVDVIRRKRDGGELEAGAIRAFVAGATDGTWPDYQLAALLMAIVCRGMTLDEAAMLTDAMARSGLRLDLSEFGGRVVDKHSTGGVGDKLSLVIAPLAAACGAIVPMIGGRGLGHTGGTVDKLAAIPGFRTQLSLDETHAALRQVGCVMAGQTKEIAPADAKLYALRDTTGTVESIPLVCSSILSKKLAEGIDALVLDVKVGRGAFMKTAAAARELAEWLRTIAERNGVRTHVLLTAMDHPLGRAVGNASEVVEAIETLKGRGPADVEDLSVRLAAEMLVAARLAAGRPEADARVRRALATGEGLDRFGAIVEQQGGDRRVLDDYGRLPSARLDATWTADRSGVVSDIDAEEVGHAAVVLGAGRHRAHEAIDPAAGIEVLLPVGSRVRAGEAVLRLRSNDPARLDRARARLASAVTVGDEVPETRPLVIDTVEA
jgi:pyrimidine-nucleoside phosphorylase